MLPATFGCEMLASQTAFWRLTPGITTSDIPADLTHDQLDTFYRNACLGRFVPKHHAIAAAAID